MTGIGGLFKEAATKRKVKAVHKQSFPGISITKRKVGAEQYEVAKKWLEAGYPKTEIAKAIGVSRGIFYKAFGRFEKEDAAQKPSKGPTPKAADHKAKTLKPKALKAVSRGCMFYDISESFTTTVRKDTPGGSIAWPFLADWHVETSQFPFLLVCRKT